MRRSVTGAAIAFWTLAAGIVPRPAPALSTIDQQAARPPVRFKAGDKELRELAIKAPLPIYPPKSLAKKVAGVAVATIRVDAKGTPEAVAVLQSPDAATGRAVHDALMQWIFKPAFGSGSDGILVFYFHIKGRSGVVLSPAEMRALTNPGAKAIAQADEPPLESISETEFRALPTRPGPILLDIRDRQTFAEGHEKGAVNIPLYEVLTRAAAELPRSRHIVIDCREELGLCAIVVHWLRSSGFSGQVSVLRR
jgi:TonB family protein